MIFFLGYSENWVKVTKTILHLVLSLNQMLLFFSLRREDAKALFAPESRLCSSLARTLSAKRFLISTFLRESKEGKKRFPTTRIESSFGSLCKVFRATETSRYLKCAAFCVYSCACTLFWILCVTCNFVDASQLLLVLRADLHSFPAPPCYL